MFIALEMFWKATESKEAAQEIARVAIDTGLS